MKDKNWTDIVSKQGDLRHFASMAIRKSGKSEHTSAQEIDFLFRIALSEEPLTPRQITSAMGISKTIVSRLTDHLESKGFICKEASASDRRSYCIRITGAGKDEIDRTYYYYLDPLYTLQKNMKKEKFETLFQLIREANEILSSTKKNKEIFIMTGKDIDYKYVSSGAVLQLLKTQKSWEWIGSLFETKTIWFKKRLFSAGRNWKSR